MKLTLEEEIAHGGQPVLRWMMDNIFIQTDMGAEGKSNRFVVPVQAKLYERA